MFQLQVVWRKRVDQNTILELNTIILLSETSSTIPEDRGKCPKCGEYFQNRGGVFFKHITQCNVVPTQSKASSSGDTFSKKSGKTYPPSRKTNQIKHQEFCIGTEPAGQNSTSQTEVL